MRALQLICLVATLPLAACLNSTSLNANDAPLNVRAEVPLYGGRVVVRGPRGYCVDADSLRKRSNSRLLLLASCESLSGRFGVPVAPALMVVNVLAPNPGQRMPSAATIAAGMAPQTPLKTVEIKDMSLVHLASGGDLVLPGGDPRHWRGGLVINDHLVSLSVYGRKDSVVAGAGGEALIRDLAKALRRASPKVQPAPASPPPQETADAQVTKASNALWYGLFPDPG